MNPLLNVYAILILIIMLVMGITLVYTWLTNRRPPPGPARSEGEDTPATHTVVLHISWLALRYQLHELRRRIPTAKMETAQRYIVKSVLGTRPYTPEEPEDAVDDVEEPEEEEEEPIYHQSTTRVLPPPIPVPVLPPPVPVAPAAPTAVPTPPPPSLSLREVAQRDPALFDTLLYGLLCRVYIRALQEGGRITREGFVRNSKLHSPEEQRMRISPSEWNLLMKEGEGWLWQAGLLQRIEGVGVCLRMQDLLAIILDENGTPHASGGIALMENWVDDHWHELRRGQDPT